MKRIEREERERKLRSEKEIDEKYKLKQKELQK